MKKKILLVVLAGVLTLTLGTATVLAASENFTDQNDGVCDIIKARPARWTGQATKMGNVTARSPAISRTRTATVFVTTTKAPPARKTAQATKTDNVTARKTVPATGTATNTVRNKKELL